MKVAYFLISQGRSDEATVELGRLIEIASTPEAKWPAQKKLAQIVKAQGHPKEAVLYYQEAIKNAPAAESCEIGLDLGELFEMQGEGARAMQEYGRVAELCRDNSLIAGKAHDKLNKSVKTQ
jgi:tetratricopeptide (TPR) repeat protein